MSTASTPSATDSKITTLVALLHGPDQPGLVAKTSGWIYENGGNILHADQHRDMQAEIFFQRIEWTASAKGLASDGSLFRRFAENLGMKVQVSDASHQTRVAIFVSKFDHCFHDLILRWKSGDYNCDITAIISNHRNLEAATHGYGLSFYHIPVTAEAKAAAEAEQLALCKKLGIELVIMARYMQVLSGGFLGKATFPVINIHHSFLPAFAGGKPYHQAHTRGVKLIGATAHYATPVLDDGPIIQQDVARVTHRHSVEDMIRRGRDLEKIVLAQAVRWHLDHRVLIYGNKTVVFD